MNRIFAASLAPVWLQRLTRNRHCKRGQQNALAVLLCLLAIAGCSSKQPEAEAAASGTKAANSTSRSPAECLPSQLVLSLDSGDGRFNGMSHSGTMLVLRHTGTSTCVIPSLPTPTFSDANHQKLEIVSKDAFTHQPVSTTRIALAGDQTVTSEMRWISGDVYTHGHCESPAHIALAIGPQGVSTAFSGHLCGAAGEPSMFTMTSFELAQASSADVAEPSIIYTCADGRSLRAVYPDTLTAQLTVAGKTYPLHTAVSADGARYIGGHWQWWTKGMHKGQLAPLKPGETIATHVGVSCTAI